MARQLFCHCLGERSINKIEQQGRLLSGIGEYVSLDILMCEISHSGQKHSGRSARLKGSNACTHRGQKFKVIPVGLPDGRGQILGQQAGYFCVKRMSDVIDV